MCISVYTYVLICTFSFILSILAVSLPLVTDAEIFCFHWYKGSSVV